MQIHRCTWVIYKEAWFETSASLSHPMLDITVRKNWWNHIDASHSRQPLVKGERLVRYEVNAVIHVPVVFLLHCMSTNAESLLLQNSCCSEEAKQHKARWALAPKCSLGTILNRNAERHQARHHDVATVLLCGMYIEQKMSRLMLHTFSAFWLWSSVVSVLISVTTGMSPTGDLLVT